MKILLIGPQPPPHGGISVHVAGVQRQLVARGITCNILDTAPGCFRPGFVIRLLAYVLRGWTLQVHTNGHNPKSWLLALVCGFAGKVRGNAVLTLHSGMVSRYLLAPPIWRRRLARLVCSFYRRIVCVCPPIADALAASDVASNKIEVLPAFLGVARGRARLEPLLRIWMERHDPVFSTTLFFRPEYGFDLLIAALTDLRRIYPSLGCVVMGSGEDADQAKRQVGQAELDDNILLAGDLDHDACLAVMCASDMFLRPTLQDGDSISVREAISLQLPVVASDAGTRPAGVIVFRTGDRDDLVAKIEATLASKVAV